MEELMVVPHEGIAIEIPSVAQDDFGRRFMAGLYATDDVFQRAWDKLRDEWLTAKLEKSESNHTVRVYRRVLHAWMDWLTTQRSDQGTSLRLWNVESRHVREWQRSLKANGLSDSSINHHLSSVSSFYSFVINEKFMVAGQEMCLFADVTGSPRANPFKFGNIQRAKTHEYDRAKLLPDEDLGKVLRYLREHLHTVSGARAYALFVSYWLTGWRNAELIRMQWKHIRAHKDIPGVFVFAWKGKGGKTDDVQISPDAWEAILLYLKKDGRWEANKAFAEQTLASDEFIFRRVTDHSLGTLNGVRGKLERVEEKEGISSESALRIFRTTLKNAGVHEWSKYRLHDLRHLNAVQMIEDGASETEVMTKFHHSNLATTGRYTATMRKKRKDQALMDTRSNRLFQKAFEF